MSPRSAEVSLGLSDARGPIFDAQALDVAL
jgi:hypothetical protein